jgi:hypothetical protein
MIRFISLLAAVPAICAILYVTATQSAGDDSQAPAEPGFLGNLQVGQTVLLLKSKSGFYDVFMEREDATFAQLKKANRWLASGSLDYRRVTKVTGSFVELRGQDPEDISRPKGFDHVLIIPLHALRSLSYYAPEPPTNQTKRPMSGMNR